MDNSILWVNSCLRSVAKSWLGHLGMECWQNTLALLSSNLVLNKATCTLAAIRRELILKGKLKPELELYVFALIVEAAINKTDIFLP